MLSSLKPRRRKPDDDPNAEATVRTQYTDCDNECNCDFDWRAKYDSAIERLQEWWPELDITNNGGDSVQLELPLLGVSEPIEVTIAFNPEEWAYGASVGREVDMVCPLGRRWRIT